MRDAPTFRQAILGAVALIGSTGVAVWLWGTELPLGVPGEWAWERIRYDGERLAEGLHGAAAAVIAATLYIGFCAAGARRLLSSLEARKETVSRDARVPVAESSTPQRSTIADCGFADSATGTQRWETALWLFGLVVAGFVWLWFVQDAPPVPHERSRSVRVLYYPGSSGYFHTARYGITETDDFLAGYEARMAEGDVLHVGTHPPGLFLLYRGLIAACDHWPWLAESARATEPYWVAAALDDLQQGESQSARTVLPRDRAVLWLATLLTQFVAAATVWPLHLLLRRTESRAVSFMAASFWPLLPALGVFLPKSDALYPFLGVLFLWLALTAVERRSLWAGLLLGVAAGGTLWLGLLLSLAFLPVALLGGVLGLIALLCGERSMTWRTLLIAAMGIAAGLILPTLLLGLIYEINLPVVWWWNYRNHAAFYDHYERTWWRWLLYNPPELAWAAGLPLLLCGVTGGIAGWRRGAWSLPLSVALVWGLLWLSGKTMGEAARLWILLCPWLVWLSGPLWERFSSRGTVGWAVVLALQAALCIATVMRINGFALP